MMEKVYASSLKGYATPEMLWRFLLDVSRPMAERHARHETSGPVDLDTVTVEDDTFIPGPAKAVGTPEEDVWQLAAASFELATGSPLFPAREQKATTPIPALRQPELERFSDLMGRCLAFDAAARPSAKEIETVAAREWEKSRSRRRQRRIPVLAEKKSASDYDRHWPETFLLSLVLLIGLALPLHAQDYVPDDMTGRLVEAAGKLRKGGEQNWKEAEDLLRNKRDAFTLMDEISSPEADCPLLPFRFSCFGINRLVNGLKDGDRVQSTGKDFKNGADSRFGYAVIEKGVRQGKMAQYRMTGRQGKQVFLILPFDTGQKYHAALVWNGRRYRGIEKEDGMVLLLLPEDAGLSNYDTLVLELSNDGDADAAFILINDKIGNR